MKGVCIVLQGSGQYVKLSSGNNKNRKINNCTPVCTFLQLSASCARMRCQKNCKLSRENVCKCGFTRQKFTFDHNWRSLQARYIKSINCYVDSDFAGGWDHADANDE